ncbi:MAG: hypothetical protein KAT56_08845 [Sedimentisphaerales bacterium]|nr:hypothetical protein [Sedimentisphaerales bacterium]
MLKPAKNQGISCYRGIMLLVLVGALFVVSAPNQGYADSPQLVATFADPSLSGNTPLFEIDFGYPGSLTGGWTDDQTGLNLEIVGVDDPYMDAFFIMPEPIVYYGDIRGGSTGPGTIEFYADGDTVMAEALLKLEFGYASLGTMGVGADSIIFIDNVTISGTAIQSTLEMEEFSFSFANKQPLGGNGWINPSGFTATAAFTSSAVPEPVSLGLLALGSLVFLRVGRRPVARR